ncbi:uncharacterized protein [Anabrus simplex]|uniref:uncharacterized protein n=1 Tax=Anabrus simplex TaxID=316456 RepID=UPI0035A378FC
MTSGADELPAEILLKIFSLCAYSDLVKSIPYVCSRWQEVWRDRHIWRSLVYKPTRNTKRTSIVALLRMRPHLRAVDFSKRSIRCDIVQILRDCCHEVERFCLSCNTYSDMNRLVFSPVFLNIKVLVLTEKGIPRITLQYLSSYFPKLEHLECQVKYFSKSDLVLFLVKMQNQLHTLGLRCITSDGYCILPYLSLCSKLKTLSLRHVCPSLSPEHLPLEAVPHLKNISSLALENSSTNITIFSLATFKFFPNIKELYLHYYLRPTDIFDQVAMNFPHVEKLAFRYCYNLENDTCEHLRHFDKLTSLSISYNDEITDDHVKHFKEISQLTHLELYACDKLTSESLIDCCGFSQLQVLKFDFHYNLPCKLEPSHVKNKNLRIIFYRCKELSIVENLKKGGVKVSVLVDRAESFGNSVFL